MPRPLRYAFNDWLFARIRLRYIVAVLVVLIAAAWLADAAGWLPEAAPVQQVPRRAGY